MGKAKGLERLQTDDPVLNRLQDKLAEALKPMLANPAAALVDWRFSETEPTRLEPTRFLQVQYRAKPSTEQAKTQPLGVWTTVFAVPATLATWSSGQFLTRDTAGTLAWGTPAGGTTAPWIFSEKPSTADSRDEEFEGTAFSGWTQGGTPDATAIDPYTNALDSKWRYSWNGTRRSHLLLQAMTGGGGGANYMPPIYRAVTLGTNELISTRMAIDTQTSIVAGDCLIGFMLYTGAGAPDVSAVTTDRVALYLNASGAGQMKIQFDKAIAGVVTATTYNVAGPVSNGFGSLLEPIEYLWIHKIGTTYHAWCAGSPGNVIYLGNLTYAGTVDHIAVILGNTTNHAPGAPRAAVDYFRFKATATEMP